MNLWPEAPGFHNLLLSAMDMQHTSTYADLTQSSHEICKDDNSSPWCLGYPGCQAQPKAAQDGNEYNPLFVGSKTCSLSMAKSISCLYNIWEGKPKSFDGDLLIRHLS